MRLLTAIFLLFPLLSISQGTNQYIVAVVDEEGDLLSDAVIELETGERYQFPVYDGEYFIFRFESESRSLFVTVIQEGMIDFPDEPKKDFFTIYPDSMSLLTVKRRSAILNPVEVGTTLTRGPFGIRNGALSLDHDHIAERASNSLSESIDVLPGVHAVNTGVGIAKPMIRGFIGNRVQVVDNGIRQEGQQWGMDHGLEIDQFSVDEIEVLSGPAAIVEGPGMLTGVVRLNPNWRSIPAGWSGGAQVLGKSNNALIGSSLNANYRSEDQRHIVGVRVSGQDFADYRVPTEEFIYNSFILPLPNGILKNTAGQEYNAHLNYRQVLENDAFVYLSYSRFEQKVGLFPGALGIPRAFDIGNVGEQRDVQNPFQRTIHDKMLLEYQRTRGYFTHQVKFGYQSNRREERSEPHAHGLLYIDTANTLGLGLNLNTVEGKYSIIYAKDNYTITTGLNAQNKANRIDGWEFLIPNYDRFEYGAFALVNWGTSKWKYNAGVRLDGAFSDVSGYEQPYYLAPDSLVTRVEAFDLSQLQPSVSLGAARYQNNTGLMGHISYVSRLPAVNELASNGVHHGTFRHEVGNPNLDPENGVVGEINLLWSPDRFTFRLTGFGGYYDNFIYLNPSGRFSQLPDAGQIYSYEQSPMWQVGGELIATHDWELLARNFYSYRLHQSFIAEYVQSTDAQNGLSLPFQPPFGLTYIPELEVSNGKNEYSLGIEIQWIARQEKVARNEPETPGYVVYNPYLRWSKEFDRGNEFSISLRVQNASNVAYLRHLSRYRILNIPEQGINFILQATYQF